MDIFQKEIEKIMKFKVIRKETFCGTMTHVSVDPSGSLVVLGDVIGAFHRTMKESYLLESRNSKGIVETSQI